MQFSPPSGRTKTGFQSFLIDVNSNSRYEKPTLNRPRPIEFSNKNKHSFLNAEESRCDSVCECPKYARKFLKYCSIIHEHTTKHKHTRAPFLLCRATIMRTIWTWGQLNYLINDRKAVRHTFCYKRWREYVCNEYSITRITCILLSSCLYFRTVSISDGMTCRTAHSNAPPVAAMFVNAFASTIWNSGMIYSRILYRTHSCARTLHKAWISDSCVPPMCAVHVCVCVWWRSVFRSLSLWQPRSSRHCGTRQRKAAFIIHRNLFFYQLPNIKPLRKQLVYCIIWMVISSEIYVDDYNIH